MAEKFNAKIARERESNNIIIWPYRYIRSFNNKKSLKWQFLPVGWQWPIVGKPILCEA